MNKAGPRYIHYCLLFCLARLAPQWLLLTDERIAPFRFAGVCLLAGYIDSAFSGCSAARMVGENSIGKPPLAAFGNRFFDLTGSSCEGVGPLGVVVRGGAN